MVYGGKGDDRLSAYYSHKKDENDLFGGASTMYGGRGDDVLLSANGIATITGGAGADVFKLYRSSDTVTITDFVSGEDRIKFDYDAKISASDLRIEADGDDILITRPTAEQIRLLGLSPRRCHAGHF